MIFNLKIPATSIALDTDHVDPDLITEATQELDLFTDENGDELKPQSELSPEEWKLVLSKLLADGFDCLCDLDDEVNPSTCEIEIPEDQDKAGDRTKGSPS